MNQLDKAVAATISELERQNQPQPVKMEMEWISDAERLGLPVVNRTTGSGAPLLDRDAVLRASYPNHTRRK